MVQVGLVSSSYVTAPGLRRVAAVHIAGNTLGVIKGCALALKIVNGAIDEMRPWYAVKNCG